jgi:hypothetical protein
MPAVNDSGKGSPMNRTLTRIAIALAAVAIAVAVLLWQRQKAPLPEPAAEAPADAEGSPSVPGFAKAPEAPPTQPEPTPSEAPLAAANLEEALVALLGRKPVASFLQLDDFPHRVVATVDNLPRPSATAKLWPVTPTSGRFTVTERNGKATISPDNGMRYTPLLLFVEGIDSKRLVDLYVRYLPSLQQAYQELGYPDQRFHTRLLEVIDHLLATPTVAEPIAVQLTEVKGPVASDRPWVRYEFSDASLQDLSAGQKMLLRVGSVNQRRLMSKLAELRKEIVGRPSAMPAAASAPDPAASQR